MTLAGKNKKTSRLHENKQAKEQDGNSRIRFDSPPGRLSFFRQIPRFPTLNLSLAGCENSKDIGRNFFALMAKGL
jgi:hypothetical protein